MRIEANWLFSPATMAVLDAFANAGKRVYFVGGCVRNHLLGMPVLDLDMATDALPEESQRIAENAGLRAVPTGIVHGTITVISGGDPYEITTFRRDVETDGRRAVVAFSTDIRDDARRRDFTMNALYADRQGRIIDPLNGLPDLYLRRIKFIENADQRIAEDYLRILRFFRFHAWYGDPEIGMDVDGLAACAAGVAGIDSLSKERIGAEMCKLLEAPDPAPALASMAHTGVLARVLPGADPSNVAPLVHLETMGGTAPHWLRRLAVLGGENPKENLRLSKAQDVHLSAIHKILNGSIDPAQAAYRFGAEVATDAVLVLAASLGSPVAADSFAEIARGMRAKFPVYAKDLQPAFTGKALGTELKRLQSKWFASGMRASRSELLN